MNKQQISGSSPLRLAVIIIGCLSSTSSISLEADKDQELLFSADGGSHMSIEGDIRLMEMSDNVIITRGTMVIRGDTATIESIISSGEVSKVTVLGTPVYYEQQLDSNDEPVKGSSNSISFYTDADDGSSVVELIGEAVIESPTSNFKCSAIVYIAEQDLIRDTQGPCSGAFNTSN
ncbi:MAG: LptA/OstA family protein [Gammaproteobacteria bacterium]|jgi:lipopolysaccharide transport protein LptA|tara:strand:- start:804 stop:1331 length:528 start_codon:yes stop_codon:yes gene_type:complete